MIEREYTILCPNKFQSYWRWREIWENEHHIRSEKNENQLQFVTGLKLHETANGIEAEVISIATVLISSQVGKVWWSFKL